MTIDDIDVFYLGGTSNVAICLLTLTIYIYIYMYVYNFEIIVACFVCIKY